MSNVRSTIEKLERLGIQFYLVDGKLKSKAKKGAITTEVSALIKDQKQEIVDFLSCESNETEHQKKLPKIEKLSLDKAAMSFAQQRLWFIDKLHQGTVDYNISAAFSVIGHLNIALVEKVLNIIIERHEILRTIYVEERGSTIQHIMPFVNFAITQHDLSSLNGNDKSKALQALVINNAKQPFNLESDLMLRVSYIQLAHEDTSVNNSNEGVLLFNVHHIAFDGWSKDILLREFVTLYRSFSEGIANPLPALDIQYSDYATWQRGWLKGEALESQISYWEKQLYDIPHVHGLQLESSRSETNGRQGAKLIGSLPKTISKALQDKASEYQLTPFMLLHGALSLLLSQYSDSNDIVIGTPIANRLEKKLSSLIGFFVNTLVLRVDTAHENLADYFAHVRQVHLGAQSNQDVPFEQLVERLKVPRSNVHSPLFQIMLTADTNNGVDSGDIDTLDLSGVQLAPYQSESILAKFELEVHFSIGTSGIKINWIYDKCLFSEDKITRLNAHLCHLLTALSEVAEESESLDTLMMLSETDQHHLLTELNDTRVAYPKELCIHELFEQQAIENPDNVAVVFQGEQLTYKALNERSNQLAHYLVEQHQIKPDTLVGLCTERSLEMVIGILGILKAGGAYVPMDPSYPKERLAYIMEDAALDVVLTQGLGAEALAGHTGSLIGLEAGDVYASYSKVGLERSQQGLTSKNLAYVIYTSGSTGKPKGVMIEHLSLLNYQLHMQEAYAMSSDDVILQFSNICFDIFVEEFFGSLTLGASLVLSDSECRNSLQSFIRFCERYSVSIVSLPTAFWAQLVCDRQVCKASSLKTVIVGGETLTASTVSNHYHCLGSDTQLINTYGPTETTITAATYVTSNDDDCEKPVPIGKANINNQLLILDSRQNLIPKGSVGELYIGGDGLARGYLNREELTAKHFIKNPFYCDGGSEYLYRTGDLVRYVEDGNIEFLGREDDQVKIRGFRVELGEVELQLATQAGVDSAVAMVKTIAGNQQLIGYIKLNHAVDELAQTDFALQVQKNMAIKLPDYMIPNLIQVVEGWPLTPNGKVNRRALPLPDEGKLHGEYIAPETDVELLLSRVWSELLGIDAGKISKAANFFELGGHSLLAMRLSSKIRELLNMELEVTAVFATPILQELAKEIEIKHCTTSRPEVIPVERENGIAELSFAQQRILLVDQMQGASPEYNMPTILKVSGDLDIKLVEKTLNAVIARHEVLRTVYIVDSDIHYQKIRNEFQFVLGSHDLSNLPEKERGEICKSLIGEELNSPFDLRKDLMIRGAYVCLKKANEYSNSVSEGLLMLNMHHIASDGWSTEVLIQEFFTIYQSLLEKKSITLPNLEIQYADYAIWQKKFIQDGMLESQLDYWQRQLEEVPPLHGLQLDKKRPPVKGYEGGIVTAELPSNIAKTLLKLANQQQLTPFMLLHSALAVVLSLNSNSHDIVVGTPIANRLQSELDPLIGFFTNTLVLRVNTDYETLDDFFAAVRNVHLGALSHQDVPFEQLVEKLNIPRGAGHTPLFQILLTTNTNYGVNSAEQQALFNLPGVEFHSLQPDTVHAKFDLNISLNISEQGIGLKWIYDVGLFNQTTIERLNDQLQRVLCEYAEHIDNTEFKMDDLTILSSSESEYLIHEVNSNTVEYAQDKCVHELISYQAQLSPYNTAIISAGESMSYQELDKASNKLAQYLVREGVGIGDCVGVCYERSTHLLVCFLAVLKVGAAYIPFEPRNTEDRNAQIIADAKPKIVLVNSSLVSFIPQEVVKVLIVDKCLKEHRWLEQYSDNPLNLKVSLDNVAYIIYTSGSTGKPKGVEICHASLMDYLNYGLTHYYDRMKMSGSLLVTSHAFDIGVPSLYLPLLSGNIVKLLTQNNVLPDLSKEIRQKGNQLLRMTPKHVEGMLVLLGDEICLNGHVFVIGGERFESSLAKRLQVQFPNSQIYNHYGPSESTVGCIIYDVTAHIERLPDELPIGRVMPNAQAYVLDDRLRLLPKGVIGELYIGGNGLAKGYLNNAALSTERFIESPFSKTANGITDTRLYKTGDLVRFATDGNLEFIGRSDDQVKVLGYRIELGDLEYHLTQQVEVDSTVIIVKENNVGDKYLVAYVKSSQEYLTCETIEVHAFEFTDRIFKRLKALLPYYMVPSSIVLVEEWPLTPNGKIDKKALSNYSDDSRRQSVVVAHTEVERELVAIWSKLSGSSVDEVCIERNLFDQGGHSLLIVRLFTQVRNVFSVELTMSDFIRTLSLREISSFISSFRLDTASELDVEDMEELEL
ncbi:hypothetical protein PCIT_a3826 [Pseudoalteromonas citrea]|uniref:Carrier domain-containing protein n=2 Tax=Pseudoalteromonas citrea TaxID=43655 RepID=A0AAD4AGB2_9GAMM|nr:non-ribosomal peptide synthetase [Pseudoalteromonas citrea]KAF7767739.1 hypothetical protein PCIT_a3826 [Pseudoalteromonas citrea]